jgi:Cu/Ag efflux pump CusA
VLSSYHGQRQSGVPREAAVLRAAEVRMRPVVMMCLSACIGLLPAALSTSIGAETQRPLAMVIVGGMSLAPGLILLVAPVLISFLPARYDADEPANSMRMPQEERVPSEALADLNPNGGLPEQEILHP